MSAPIKDADERVMEVLEELLEKFGQQHAWITNVAAASIVQQAIDKLSKGRASLGAAQVPSLEALIAEWERVGTSVMPEYPWIAGYRHARMLAAQELRDALSQQGDAS